MIFAGVYLKEEQLYIVLIKLSSINIERYVHFGYLKCRRFPIILQNLYRENSFKLIKPSTIKSCQTIT